MRYNGKEAKEYKQIKLFHLQSNENRKSLKTILVHAKTIKTSYCTTGSAGIKRRNNGRKTDIIYAY
jgi:hypothetical protein